MYPEIVFFGFKAAVEHAIWRAQASGCRQKIVGIPRPLTYPGCKSHMWRVSTI